MSRKMDHIVVVGGGVIGAMSAWYLTESGRQVTIVDGAKYGAACSHGNCGFICPSHVMPLPAPGAIRHTLPYLLKRNAPFRIKFPMSFSMMAWFRQFAKHCKADIMWETARARHELLQLSSKLYQSLIEDQNIDCEYEHRGLMFVYRDEHEFEAFEKTATEIHERFGVETKSYDRKQLPEIEPALKEGLGGAWHFLGDCHLRPDKLMSGLRAKLEERGTRFVEGSKLKSFVSESGIAKGVELTGSGPQTIEADGFVIATGAMTPMLNDQLGCRLNIQPGKGYSITMPRPAKAPQHPMIFEQDRVAVTPMQSGYRIGSMMEFVGYDQSIQPQRLELLRKGARYYLHDPYAEPVQETWYGWRPMTWDGKPIIDQAPVHPNVWIAAGHNMLGLSMGAGTGKLISQMIGGETPSIDTNPFRVSRF